MRWAAEGVDDVDGVGEKDVVASLARGISERGSEVRLAKAHEAEENHVGFVLDELQTEEVPGPGDD